MIDSYCFFRESDLLIVMRKAGKRIKLQIMAISNVTEIRIPNAWVPLKVEAVKIKKPENRITTV